MAQLLRIIAGSAMTATVGAQTTILDIPFFGTSPIPSTGAILSAEYSSTIITFGPSLSTLSFWSTESRVMTYGAYLAIGPHPEGSAWYYAHNLNDDTFLASRTSTSCSLVSSDTVTTCEIYEGHNEAISITFTAIERWPITITSGARLLLESIATASPTPTPSTSLVELDIQVIETGFRGLPISADIIEVKEDTTTLYLNFELPGSPSNPTDGLNFFLTMGPSIWQIRPDQPGVTGIMDCDFPFSISIATCRASWSGPTITESQVSTIYSEVATLTATITEVFPKLSGSWTAPKASASAAASVSSQTENSRAPHAGENEGVSKTLLGLLLTGAVSLVGMLVF